MLCESMSDSIIITSVTADDPASGCSSVYSLFVADDVSVCSVDYAENVRRTQTGITCLDSYNDAAKGNATYQVSYMAVWQSHVPVEVCAFSCRQSKHSTRSIFIVAMYVSQIRRCIEVFYMVTQCVFFCIAGE